MNPINYTPAARPVDTYSRPEVRLGNSGSAFASLAESLQIIQPSLNRFTQMVSEKERVDGLDQAARFLQQNQLESIGQYNEMVKSGQIDENENPWKMKFTRQMLAKQQFRSVAAEVQSELLTDPQWKSSDDFAGLQSEVLRRTHDKMGDMDNATLVAVTQDYDAFAGDFLDRHQRRRLDEREDESREAFMGAMSTALTGSPAAMSALVEDSDSPQVKALADATVENVQGILSTFAMSAPPAKARQFAALVIAEAAIAAGDPRVADVLLERLQVEGIAIGTAFTPTDRAKIVSQIERGQMDKARTAVSADNELSARRLAAAKATLRGQVDQKVSPLNAKVDLSELGPDELREYTSFVNFLNGKIADERLASAASKVIGGRFTPEVQAEYEVVLVGLGASGLEALNRLNSFRQAKNKTEWGETSREVIMELHDLHMSGMTMNQKIDALVDISNTGRISQADFQAAFDRISRMDDVTQGTIQAIIGEALTRSEVFLREGYLQDPNRYVNLGEGPELNMESENDLKMALAVTNMRIYSFLGDNPDATEEEIMTYVDGVIDDVSGKAGGFTRDKREKNTEKTTSIRSIQNQRVFVNRDGNVMFDKGIYKVTLSSGGTYPYPGNIRMFEDTEDFKNRFDHASSVGVPMTPEGHIQFFKSQIAALNPSTDRTLINLLRKAIKAHEDYAAERARKQALLNRGTP